MSVRGQIMTFLRDPLAFARAPSDPEVWRAGLTAFAVPSLEQAGGPRLLPAQVDAWVGLAETRAGLVLGPPGTGKTHLLAWLILGYVRARREAGLPARVFVSAFTRNAIGNLLDAVAARVDEHGPDDLAIRFFGNEPASGLAPRVIHRPSVGGREGAAALAELRDDAVVMGASIWTLHRLMAHRDAGGDGFTAGIFDLVCVDEASQLVLAHGLMTMAGLKTDGRLVVAGDDRQLPPIRAGREVAIGGRQLGGSLYGFLKSAAVPEFPLVETFRLNGPLAAFPERKFYEGRFRSAVPDRTLDLVPGWRDGLAPWEAMALDPAWPVVVMLHDGPASATSNTFEARTAARLAAALAARMPGAMTDQGAEAVLWQERLAIASPHRAQNALIRLKLPPALRDDAYVETVDRIQGKERDAVILSYCVADAEFALAEADFIFSPERLNVAVTRARSKLVLLISRRLLNAVPSDQDQMDKAETVREFVFGTTPAGSVTLEDDDGSPVSVQLRMSGLGAVEPLGPEVPAAAGPAPAPPQDLEWLVQAVGKAALASRFGTATLSDLRRLLAGRDGILPGLAALHAQGRVRVEERAGKMGPFLIVRRLDPPAKVFPVDLETVRARLEEVIRETRRGGLAPFHNDVRRRFAWFGEHGEDLLAPIVERLKEEGLVCLGAANGSVTVDWVDAEADGEPPEASAAPLLADADFEVLNALEDVEARRINFGVFEGWTSAAALAEACEATRDVVVEAVGRLAQAGWVMVAEEGRVRSRMAELAREVRYVKQRFRRDDADERPFLVRSVKVVLRDRDKPRPQDPVREAFARVAAEVSSEHGEALLGFARALEKLWGGRARLAGFQARSFSALSHAWHGRGGDVHVIAADTGSGKTEAAVLPIIAAAAADRMAGVRGVRAILAYPRVRLATNQAQRLAKYLAALAEQEGMPTLTLGLQIAAVPRHLGALEEWSVAAGWAPAGPGRFAFPFFSCPTCSADLLLERDAGTHGADRLACVACEWAFDGWIGSKDKLRDTPPTFFVPTMDSLHQWMHDERCGRLFGDDPGFAPPRAVLADEIHLYSHVHGAQVGMTLRRLAARAEANAGEGTRMLAIGMSATLGDPRVAWGRLVARPCQRPLTPTAEERVRNPRGREYFYFVQPEVESRGKDVAGASATIQTLMCLSHGMRRRTGTEGGFRSLVFLDSIDKVRRLHAAYDDAETHKRLAALRTRNYPEDPASGLPREGCCGEPHGCDAFRGGECWYFAATDAAQRSAAGRRPFGRPLGVAEQPVSSEATGRVEAVIRNSDVVFATSSLEVGYDDPDITLVYQHYAPRNLASFVQRKGRGGRGADDRPLTAVTLSMYSSRDAWWFRSPEAMVDPADFDVPINPDNHFVRRGQLLAGTLDAFARHARQGDAVDLRRPSRRALRKAEALVQAFLGPEPWREFNCETLEALWAEALATSNAVRFAYPAEVRQNVGWIPDNLFDAVNLPRVRVLFGDAQERLVDVTLGLATTAPGNATRRFGTVEVHWRPPADGLAPWFDARDYASGRWDLPFGEEGTEWLSRLPDEARAELADVDHRFFRPAQVTLGTLGRAHGAGWQSDWVAAEPPTQAVAHQPGAGSASRRVRHDSTGSLRGFPVVKADVTLARQLSLEDRLPLVASMSAFVGDARRGRATGLALARVYWGADSEVKLEGPPADTVSFSQTFCAPGETRPLLHGYHVHTEGVQLRLEAASLDAFVAAEAARLEADPAAKRWHAAQMLRFLVEGGAQAAGVGAYDARRGAELLVSAAAEPELKGDLRHLMHFWDGNALADLFEKARERLLSQHPMLGRRRVARVAEALSADSFKGLLSSATRQIADPTTFSRYIRTKVVHALAVRLKESFLQVGRGDERQVVMHVRLPIQFADAEAAPTITICEAGAYGDGTTRAFLDRLHDFARHWTDGFVTDCPNARDDAALERLFAQPERHATWRALDPKDPAALAILTYALRLAPGTPTPTAVLRILFGSEAVGAERFDLFDLALPLRTLDRALTTTLGRVPSPWELTSAAVRQANEVPGSVAGRLLRAYAGIEDADQEGSLSPDARLADQLQRLHGRLCVDGCRACVHQSGDMMSDTLVESSTSRSMLGRFVCGAS